MIKHHHYVLIEKHDRISNIHMLAAAVFSKNLTVHILISILLIKQHTRVMKKDNCWQHLCDSQARQNMLQEPINLILLHVFFWILQQRTIRFIMQSLCLQKKMNRDVLHVYDSQKQQEKFSKHDQIYLVLMCLKKCKNLIYLFLFFTLIVSL